MISSETLNLKLPFSPKKFHFPCRHHNHCSCCHQHFTSITHASKNWNGSRNTQPQLILNNRKHKLVSFSFETQQVSSTYFSRNFLQCFLYACNLPTVTFSWLEMALQSTVLISTWSAKINTYWSVMRPDAVLAV